MLKSFIKLLECWGDLEYMSEICFILQLDLITVLMIKYWKYSHKKMASNNTAVTPVH